MQRWNIHELKMYVEKLNCNINIDYENNCVIWMGIWLNMKFYSHCLFILQYLYLHIRLIHNWNFFKWILFSCMFTWMFLQTESKWIIKYYKNGSFSNFLGINNLKWNNNHPNYLLRQEIFCFKLVLKRHVV